MQHTQGRALASRLAGRRFLLVAASLLIGLAARPHRAQAQAERPGSFPPWGRVGDAKLVGADRIVVVDRQDRRVWLVDAAGRLVSTVGRAGAGPGEFRELERLVRLDDSTVGVIDRPNARLTRLRVRPDSLVIVGTHRFDPSAESACVRDQALVVSSANTEASTQLARLGTDGMPQGPFGRVVFEGTPSLRRRLLYTTVGCGDGASDVFTGSWHAGEVFRWHVETGALVWRTQLPDFRKIALSATSATGVRLGWRPDGNSHLTHVIPITADTLLVSALIFWAGEAQDTATIIGSRYLLDARTGQVLSAQDATERVLDVRGPYEVVYAEDPEPKVWVRRRRY